MACEGCNAFCVGRDGRLAAIEQMMRGRLVIASKVGDCGIGGSTGLASPAQR